MPPARCQWWPARPPRSACAQVREDELAIDGLRRAIGVALRQIAREALEGYQLCLSVGVRPSYEHMPDEVLGRYEARVERV